MTSLQLLGLYDNFFQGVIPSDLGHLTKLMACYLDGNIMSGQIPPTFSYFNKSIIDLRLNDNLLSGGIPSELTTLSTWDHVFRLSLVVFA